MNQLLLITLAVLQFAVFLILMLGKLFMRSIDPKGNLYAIDKWDKALIGAVILCIGVTASLFVASTGGAHLQDGVANQPLVESGSSITQQQLIKYGYELDTSSTGIAAVIRDSFHLNNALIIKEAKPDFGLRQNEGIKIDSAADGRYALQLAFISRRAPVSGIIVRTVPALFYDESLHVAPDGGNNYFYFPVGDKLTADSVKFIPVAIPYNAKGIIYTLVTGIVSNISGSQNYMVRRIYWLDTETRQFGEAAEAHFKLIDNLYRKQGFN
jgi:hypothetical protein